MASDTYSSSGFQHYFTLMMKLFYERESFTESAVKHFGIDRGGNNSNRSRNQNRQNYNRDISNKSFEGAEPSVGAVLGLQSERIDKKFNIF